MNKFEQWAQFGRNFEKIAFQAVHDVFVANESEILRIQKEQLWDGKRADGSNITPSYLNDPFFQTHKQALAYAKWKQKITPNPDRDFAAPNLFIRGDFYQSIFVKPMADSAEFGSNSALGQKIDSKFKGIFGLNQKGRELLLAIALPVVCQKLKAA